MIEVASSGQMPNWAEVLAQKCDSSFAVKGVEFLDKSLWHSSLLQLGWLNTDCGAVICLDCRTECRGDSFCEPCYNYYVTHSMCQES